MSDIGDPFQLEELLSRVTGCGYTLAVFVAAVLAAAGAARLRSKGEGAIGPGIAALGLGLGTGAAVLGDVVVFLELEPVPSMSAYLAIRILGIVATLVVVAGVALTVPRRGASA